MELTVAIQSKDEMGILENPWDHPCLTEIELETCQSLKKAISETFGDIQPTRVYFGSEFCQYRLYTIQDLVATYEAVERLGYDFSLVAPSLPQMSIEKFDSILSEFAKFISGAASGKKIEVICNDWGTLQLVKCAHRKTFTPVLGRLMNKMIRDPRATQYYNREVAPTLANAHFKQGSYSINYYRDFLKEAGVETIEFDNHYQGVNYEQLNGEFKVATHFNYGCIATGRACLVGSLHVEKTEKFRGHIVCKQQCRHYTAEMVNQNKTINTMEQRVFQKGNSAFYIQTYDQIRAGIIDAQRSRVDRLVFSPKIPV